MKFLLILIPFLYNVESSDLNKFGIYSNKYYEKRWERMCKTGARYDAMREAYDMGKKQPC